jgi:hypothetical protein
VDTSQFARTFTSVGSAATSTAQSKYGTYALALNGTSQSVNVPDSDDFAIGSNDFCIEYWFYQNSASTIQEIICQQNDGTGGYSFIRTIYDTNRRVYLTCANAGVTIANLQTNTTAYSTGAWNHFAFVRVGGVFKFYINGTQPSYAVNTQSTDPLANISGIFEIGRNSENGASPIRYTNGYINGFRYVVGSSVYTANFTPTATPLDAIDLFSTCPLINSASSLAGVVCEHISPTQTKFTNRLGLNVKYKAIIGV